MKENYISKALAKIVSKVIPEKSKVDFLKRVFHHFKIDPIRFAYSGVGILNFEDDIVSGEQNFMSNILPRYIGENTQGVIIDVGANQGKYLNKILNTFPNSAIHAFEPNPASYEKLIRAFGDNGKVKLNNLGVSSSNRAEMLVTYSRELDSSHSSIYRDVFTTFHKSNELTEMKIELKTLSDYCHENNIDDIDFLKIDTEGHELAVLIGAKDLIDNKRIKVIQFEFGECHVFSRVFLRDFYDLLEDYLFYRIGTNNLIDLNPYNSTNEIFRFQNIVAIKKSLQ